MTDSWLDSDNVPIPGVWLGGQEIGPFAMPFWFCLLADAPDPRQPNRRRWDVVRYSHYLDDRIWRVESTELADDNLEVRCVVDGFGSLESRLFVPTPEWVKTHGVGASPSCIAPHWIVGSSPEGLSGTMNLHLSQVLERRKAAISARASHSFSPTETMAAAFTKEYGEIVQVPLTVEILKSEPSGSLGKRPWHITYRLRHRDGETVLSVETANRFTNDSECEIDAAGHFDWE